MLVGVERPTAGPVLVDGEDVTTMSRSALRELRRASRWCSRTRTRRSNPRMRSARSSASRSASTATPCHRVGATGGQELLDLVGLDPAHVHRYPHQFSGGQRQRIGIARALAVKPQVLVCDEPVSALDVSVQGQVINLLEDLQDELGLSYLFIAHDLAVVRHIADEVAVMYLGQIVEHGAAADVYDHATHPYTRGADVRRPGSRPDRPLASADIVLEADVPSPVDAPSGCRFHPRAGSPPGWPQTGEPADGGVPIRCAAESPALVDTARPGHLAACHYADRTALTASRDPS